jgi:hypothetical protein
MKAILVAVLLMSLAACQSPISDAAIQAAVQSMVDSGALTVEQAPGMIDALTTLLASADSFDWGEVLGQVGAAILGALGITRLWRGPSSAVKPKSAD